MIITDYLTSDKNISWDYARQLGITQGTIRLPEDKNFDITDKNQFKAVVDKFQNYGIKPIIIEPIPNALHDHIKAGDSKKDECIEKVIKMMEYMNDFDIRTICFNFMAYIGWFRTKKDILERGNALVTGFDYSDFKPNPEFSISEEELWFNYEYFIKAVIPYAEKYNVKLALHPDDPPIKKLGDVSRIMVSFENIHKAVNIVKSENLGITMCQACYQIMGENLDEVIKTFAKENKIFFIHFRDVCGTKMNFYETFHDNGCTDMVKTLKLYHDLGVNVPIRVDHVPTMAGETTDTPGYANVGRLYAIGYLKGILETIEK